MFTDSVPDDHAPETMLAHDQRVNATLVSEQGPDLISVIMMDDPNLMTLLSLIVGVSATSWSNGRSLIDSGLPN